MIERARTDGHADRGSRRNGRLPGVTDSFPRRQARTRRFTLGAPRGLTRLARRRPRRVPAQPRRQRPRHLPVDARRRDRRGAPGRRPARARRRPDGPTRTSRPRSGPGASGPASRPAASSPTPPTGRSRRPRSRCPGGLYVVDLRDGTARADRRARRGDRPAARPARAAVAFVSGGRCTCTTSPPGTTRALAAPDGAARHLRARRVRRGRGDGAASAASGGRPTATSLLVARVDDVARAALAHRRPGATPTASRRSSPTRRPARRTPTVTPSRRPRRRARDVDPVGPRASTSPTSSGTPTGCSSSSQTRDQTALRALRVDPATGATAVVHEHTDPRLGRPRARRARAHGRRARSSGRRRRRRAPAARRRRAGHAAGAAGARRARRRRRHRAVPRGREPAESVGLWTWGPDGLGPALTAGTACTRAGCAGGTLVGRAARPRPSTGPSRPS